jgi:hypothetical protein
MIRVLRLEDDLQLHQWVDAQMHASFAMGCLCMFEGKALPIDPTTIRPLQGADVVDYVEQLLDERGELATTQHAVYSPEEYYWFINFCQLYQATILDWVLL